MTFIISKLFYCFLEGVVYNEDGIKEAISMGEFVFIDPYHTFSEKDLSYKVEKAKEQTEKEDKKDNNDHKSAKQ